MQFYRMMSPEWRTGMDQQLFLIVLFALADFSYKFTRNS